MGFFTVGNIITLGIVLLILILYRQMDRNSRTLKLLRDYSEKLKRELNDFVKEQGQAVKDYGISLNVERDSAKELMKRLQATQEGLVEEAARIEKIDSRLKSYEGSLAELDRMTGRVQENMNRVREESAFVETAGKRITETKNRLQELEKGLGSLENKFERENAESLEKTAEGMIASVKSLVSDMGATAEVIERKVEDHREAINKLEESRAENMARDGESINKILSKALEQAGKRADKLEETALVSLKQQAEERILRLKTAEEEKIKNYHENAAARVAEVQNLIKSLRDEWKIERAEWETGDKALREERKKDIHELNALFAGSEQRLAAAQENIEQRLAVARDSMEQSLSAAREGVEEQIRILSARVNEAVSAQEDTLLRASGETRQKVLKITGKELEEYRSGWLAERSEWETKDRSLREERQESMREISSLVAAMEQRLDRVRENSEQNLALVQENSEQSLAAAQENIEQRLVAARESMEQSLAVAREGVEERIRTLSARVNEVVSAQEDTLLRASGETRQKVLETTGKELEEYRSGWLAERSEWETKDRSLREERQESMREISSSVADMKQRLEEFSSTADRIISSQEALLLKAAGEMKREALEITGKELEEYRRAQDAEFRRLETLADDSRNLDAELRQSMQEVIGRLGEDFSRFERESADMRQTEADKFSAAALDFRKELSELEKGLAVLKSAAYENVSGELKSFEDEFFGDLAKRSGDIDQRLTEWRDGIDARLDKMGEEAETNRRELERGHAEEMRKNLSALDARLVTELERLKFEAGAFEEGIREQMSAADESVASFRNRLDQGLEEARKEAGVSIKSEVSKHSLATAETIKLYQRELDGKFREIFDFVQTRNGEISGLLDASRTDLEESREGLAGKIRELDVTIEEARRRVRDLALETDSRIASVHSSVEDAERHIREAVDQTKLIDKADSLRLEMERRIEDLKDDIDRLDQRRAEAAQLENDFVKIRRLEDDVNAKMTRFLTEKHRIETMETDFNRLLQISRAVEEKLTQVTASDDTLQELQLQIRKLEEALGSADEKYQRIEKKSRILDSANDGIDRNFKILQESEKLSEKIGGDLERYAEDIEAVKVSVEKLSAESEKARDTAERIEALDNLLEEVEERINSMQRARQWIADAEARLEGLNKQAQVQARAIDAVVKGKKSGPSADLGEGAPPQQKKENVIALARQGWKVDEIARAMKISRGEVELILEMAPRD